MRADLAFDLPVLSFAEAFDNNDFFGTPERTVLFAELDDLARHHLTDGRQPFKLFCCGGVQVEALLSRNRFVGLGCGRRGGVGVLNTFASSARNEREEEDEESEQTHSNRRSATEEPHEGSRRLGGGATGNVTPS